MRDDDSPSEETLLAPTQIPDQILKAAESGDLDAQDVLEKGYHFGSSSPVVKTHTDFVRLYRDAAAGKAGGTIFCRHDFERRR